MQCMQGHHFSHRRAYLIIQNRKWRSQFSAWGTDIRSVMRGEGEAWLRTLDEVRRQGKVVYMRDRKLYVVVSRSNGTDI